MSGAGGGAPGGRERPLTSVVVPAYNEAVVLMQSLTTLYEYLSAHGDDYRFELIVVDDGSTDETGEIAEAFARHRPEVVVLHHAVNFNLGQALRYGFSVSRGDYVVAVDCDLSYGPEHIGLLLDALRGQHAKVAIASPYMKGGRVTGVPWRRRVMSRGINRILSGAAHGRLTTVTGMVRAYDGPFLRSLNLKAMGTDLNAEILYKAQVLRARIVEVPAHLDWAGVRERAPSRRSSLRMGDTTKQYLFMGFIFRPRLYFVVPGLLLLVLAVWTLGSVGLEVLRHYMDDTGGIDPRLSRAFAHVFDERPHSFVVGGFALLVAIQLISIGILSIQSKRYFEELFHLETRLLREQLGEVSGRVAGDATRGARDRAGALDDGRPPPGGTDEAGPQPPASERTAAADRADALPSP